MKLSIAAKLTDAQRDLLLQLEVAHPRPLMVGRPSERSLRVARALERKELAFVETDELSFSYAWLNPEPYPHAVEDKPEESRRFHMERTR